MAQIYLGYDQWVSFNAGLRILWPSAYNVGCFLKFINCAGNVDYTQAREKTFFTRRIVFVNTNLKNTALKYNLLTAYSRAAKKGMISIFFNRNWGHPSRVAHQPVPVHGRVHSLDPRNYQRGQVPSWLKIVVGEKAALTAHQAAVDLMTSKFHSLFPLFPLFPLLFAAAILAPDRRNMQMAGGKCRHYL